MRITPKLLFFSRVAFICNICFAAAYMMHYLPRLSNGVIPSTILIMGNIMAIGINVLINILYALSAVMGRKLTQSVPRWLVIANFLFFIFQIILLIK